MRRKASSTRDCRDDRSPTCAVRNFFVDENVAEDQAGAW